MKNCTYIVCEVTLQEADSFEGTAGDSGSYAIAWWYRNGYSTSYSYWNLGGSGYGDDTGTPYAWGGYPTMTSLKAIQALRQFLQEVHMHKNVIVVLEVPVIDVLHEKWYL